MLRHDFLLTNKEAVDSYWQTLEYCHVSSDRNSVPMTFPGSAVKEVCSLIWFSYKYYAFFFYILPANLCCFAFGFSNFLNVLGISCNIIFLGDKWDSQDSSLIFQTLKLICLLTFLE